jgi:predicted XRE-type DNA-binding protein
MPKRELDYLLSSGNVFADLGLPNPEEALAKAELANKISVLIRERNLTQAKAAKLLGIDQPKVSMLLRGRLTGFSLERLMRFLLLLSQDVKISVHPSPRGKSRPRSVESINARNQSKNRRIKSVLALFFCEIRPPEAGHSTPSLMPQFRLGDVRINTPFRFAEDMPRLAHTVLGTRKEERTMRNITVSVSDETYCQARVWAAQRDTSVSAIVQYLLQTLPSVTRAATAFPVGTRFAPLPKEPVDQHPLPPVTHFHL